MKEDEKVLKSLTDEELMQLDGGFFIIDVIKEVISKRPPIMALYAVSPTIKRI
ncbi:hypothetical protein QTL86_17655 [Cellulosilyticum sp. ST5]|uniref:Uncharacterized protein n=1 Tax=Cellulosilyticum lentocellum (strain ATCC 49066 / DSM 5427 / NCIMB 11756 / RHM5) TaxID=642492 RepID=F2JH37_CELLD|nr:MULTISPECIES: hypothetical protein [Cellulosilyticum]ADZ81852.1 hypothetical protein Clole_0092 [Cellulosilyticum lentocellum DSM 5427]